MFEQIVIPKNLDCQRLFHGRGHAYPSFEHINIDWFSPIVLITLYQPVDELWLATLNEFLQKNLPQAKSIQVQSRFISKAPINTIFGEDIEQLVATENSLKFHISLGINQNSGLFLDMANGRHWVNKNSKNLKVLNLFAYTCAFSVAAIAGEANLVVNVDISKASLGKGRENHRLNQHELTKVKFEGVDIFKSYNRLKKYGPYDLLICDPPSFQKGSVDIKRDYKKIISRIPQLMAEKAKLLLCLNSPDLDEQFLLATVAQECPDCHFLKKIENPDVFIEREQGKGLKVMLFEYAPKFSTNN